MGHGAWGTGGGDHIQAGRDAVVRRAMEAGILGRGGGGSADITKGGDAGGGGRRGRRRKRRGMGSAATEGGVLGEGRDLGNRQRTIHGVGWGRYRN